MRAKIVIFVCTFLGFVTSSWCQEDQFMVLYTSSSDGIVYTVSQEKTKRIIAGIKLPPTGKIRLEQGKWITVLFDGKKRKLEGPVLIDLKVLADNIQSEKKSTFLNRFFTFISNSVNDTENAKDLEQYHKEYITNSRAGINGFGDSRFEIQTPLYFSSLIGEAQLKLFWDSIPTINGYTLEITSRETEAVVFKAQTRSNSIAINLEELNILYGEIYEWKVKAVKLDSSVAVSPDMFFTYAPDEVSDLIEDIQSDEDYLDLETSEKEPFLLYELEQNEAFHVAYLKYRELIDKESDNLLYQKLFAAFLARMNALEEAKGVLEGRRPKVEGR